MVVITGAGISTAAGIPDFRGPKGIWTKEKEAKQKPSRKRKQFQLNESQSPLKKQSELNDFTQAKPTICHRAITKLTSLNKINYVITQNVDGLHRRAGLPRDKHASVHGCVFTEKCETCGAEFFRDYDVGGMSFQKTGRDCTLCKGALRDTLLDWEDPLPEEDIDRAQEECEKPGTLVLCLGTSLRILPVGDLPLSATKFVVVNLQQTPKDEQAALVIRGTADYVMHELMVELGMPDWQKEKPPSIERVWKPKKESTPSSGSGGSAE